MFKKVAFTMYPVTDLDRVKKFYENTLGLTRSKVSAEGPGWNMIYRKAVVLLSPRLQKM